MGKRIMVERTEEKGGKGMCEKWGIETNVRKNRSDKERKF
jgi:hypothetical protein